MDEGFRRKVKDFLNGSLDKKGTLEVLDQVRKSEVCRRFLEDQARAAASARRVAHGESAASAHGCETVRPPLDTRADLGHSVETDWGSLLESKKKRGLRRTVLLGLAVLVFMAVGSKVLRKPEATLDPDNLVLIRALEKGNPVLTDPEAGILEARPITVAALLPAGNESVKLIIFGLQGLLLEMPFKSGEPGVDFEPGHLRGPKGEFPCVEALLPFPASDRLALVSGERYFLTVELPNGRQSNPLSFDFRKD
jgi:hypothetical protein